MSFKTEGRKAFNHLERHNIIVFDSEERKTKIRSKHYRYPDKHDKVEMGHSKNLHPDQNYEELVNRHKASKTLFTDKY